MIVWMYEKKQSLHIKGNFNAYLLIIYTKNCKYFETDFLYGKSGLGQCIRVRGSGDSINLIISHFYNIQTLKN